jgi:hypothetical protein
VHVLREFGSSLPDSQVRRFARHRAGTREAGVSTKYLRDLDLIMTFLVIVFVVSLVIWWGLSSMSGMVGWRGPSGRN